MSDRVISEMTRSQYVWMYVCCYIGIERCDGGSARGPARPGDLLRAHGRRGAAARDTQEHRRHTAWRPCVHVCVISMWCIVCVRGMCRPVRQLKWMTFVAAALTASHPLPLTRQPLPEPLTAPTPAPTGSCCPHPRPRRPVTLPLSWFAGATRTLSTSMTPPYELCCQPELLFQICFHSCVSCAKKYFFQVSSLLKGQNWV